MLDNLCHLLHLLLLFLNNCIFVVMFWSVSWRVPTLWHWAPLTSINALVSAQGEGHTRPSGNGGAHIASLRLVPRHLRSIDVLLQITNFITELLSLFFEL